MLRPALLAAAAAMAAAPIVAQAQSGQASGNRITVIAPRPEYNPTPNLIGRERALTASAIVQFDDLNLRTEEGRDMLEQRVRNTAEEICAWIEDVYPVQRDITSEYDCVRNAVEGAQPQINWAINLYGM